MADIQPALDAIDEAIEGYVTWSGYSPDAMRWSADDKIGEDGVYCPPCPMCGTPIASITRGRTHVDGPFRPTTYAPCGCQPGARVGEGLATGGIVYPPHNPLWMLGADPTEYFVSPRFEPGEITHLSIGGLDVTHMVRSVTLDNREATFTPTGIINQPVITGPMFSEPMSYFFDHDVATYRFGMRFTQPRSFTYSGVFDAFSEVGKELDKLMRWVNRAERIKQLHRAYRHRCLARRRRNR